MDEHDNDHLVYPNLVAAHIKTANASTLSLKSLPPPPSSSVLRKVEECPAYRTAAPEEYDFEVEEEMLKRARERKGEGSSGDAEQSVEMDLGGVLKSGFKYCAGACNDALDKVKK